jgi:hypothetical protein
MKSITQHSFLPDNDHERRVVRASVPVAKRINGRWCWLVSGTDEYQHEPELERILLAAMARRVDAAA